VRAIFAVTMIAALLIAACGEDGDSGPSTTSEAKQPTGPTANPGAEARGRERRGDRGATRRKPGSKRGTTVPDQLEGSAFFHRARARCITIPVQALARIYQAKSDDPTDVANAYADREAPEPIYREAAVAGCLAGLNSRPRP
jgi:hypothetical protein